jgi:hypothetical protein
VKKKTGVPVIISETIEVYDWDSGVNTQMPFSKEAIADVLKTSNFQLKVNEETGVVFAYISKRPRGFYQR